MDKYCKHCGEQLVDSLHFCNIECEKDYRDTTDELYVIYNDGIIESYCPIQEFKETEKSLIVNNGFNRYVLPKNEIKEWYIDKCGCIREFMQL